jgi:hypothetical protein
MLFMNAMAKKLKILQDLMLNEKETNKKLSQELKEAHKKKGAKSNDKATKAMKTQMLNPFTGKDTRAKKVRQWVLQVEAY